MSKESKQLMKLYIIVAAVLIIATLLIYFGFGQSPAYVFFIGAAALIFFAGYILIRMRN